MKSIPNLIDKLFIRYYLIIYNLYMLSMDIFIPKKTIFSIVFNAVALLFLVYITVARGIYNKKFIFVYLYIIFLVLLVIIQSSDYLYSFANLVKYIMGLMCLPIGFNILSSTSKYKEFQKTGISCLMIYVINIFLANIFDWRNSDGLYSVDGLRFGNLFGDSMYENAYLVASLFLLLTFFSKYKKGIILLLVACSILVIINMKRTTIAVLIIGLVAYLILYFKDNTLKKQLSLIHLKYLKYFLIMFIISIPFSYSYMKVNYDARQKQFAKAREDITNEGRVAEFLVISNDIFCSNKISLFLFGKETFNLVGTYGNGSFGGRQIHNDYSKLINGTGVIGLFFWILIFCRLITWMQYLRKTNSCDKGKIGAILYPLYFSFIIIYCISMTSGVMDAVLSSSFFYASLGGMLRYFYNRNLWYREMLRVEKENANQKKLTCFL